MSKYHLIVKEVITKSHREKPHAENRWINTGTTPIKQSKLMLKNIAKV